MVITSTAEIKVGGTAQDLLEAIETIPPNARVTARVEKGDRPFESDWHYLKFTWTETR